MPWSRHHRRLARKRGRTDHHLRREAPEAGLMGLREFRDSTGIVWRVWDVTPEVLDKRTTAEDFMQDWQDGWLCFESESSRRRLATYPTKWETMPEAELEELLVKAQPVKQRSAGSSTGQVPVYRPAPAPALHAESPLVPEVQPERRLDHDAGALVEDPRPLRGQRIR